MKLKMQIDPSNEERKQKKLKVKELKLICKIACSLSAKFLQNAHRRSPYVQWPVQSAHLSIHNARRMYILNQHLQSVMVQSSYYIHLAEAKIIISPLQLFCGQDNTTCLLTY